MSNLWVFNEDNSGLIYASADEILQDYTDLFKQVFPDINTEPSTAIGQIISALAQDDINLIDKMRQLSDYFFNGGSGLMLDIWAYNNFRVIRKNAIPSNVVVTIFGVPNTKIPKDFAVSDGSLSYYTELETIIPLSGEIDLLFVAKEIYDKASLANTITTILTPVSGVDRVNNSNPSNIGLNRETDSQLYLRCMELGSTFRNSSLRSILANIAQLDNVIKVSGFENKTDKEITERNVKIPPHSFIAIVLGGSDYAIGESISYSKPVGAGTTGNTSVDILIDNKVNTYFFERPSYVALKVDVNCQLNLTSPKSFADIVKDAVIQFVEKLDIGDYITQPALAKAISSQSYGFDVNDVKFGKKAVEVVTYPEYEESQTLYTKTGGGSLPENYEEYTPTEAVYILEDGQYKEFNTQLYTKRDGMDSGEMTQFDTQLYKRKVESVGGDIGYQPIQLDLNQLALINRDDISVSGS